MGCTARSASGSAFLAIKPTNPARGRRKRQWAMLCLVAALAAPGAGFADTADPVAGIRRLAELSREGKVKALADTGSGITRDVGSIAIIEHDGSNYDMDAPDGTPNYAARGRVARRFYETHGDNYDFLVVFTNFEFETPGRRRLPQPRCATTSTASAGPCRQRRPLRQPGPSQGLHRHGGDRPLAPAALQPPPGRLRLLEAAERPRPRGGTPVAGRRPLPGRDRPSRPRPARHATAPTGATSSTPTPP